MHGLPFTAEPVRFPLFQWNIIGTVDFEPDFIAVDYEHFDHNIVANDDGLIRGKRKDKHWPTSMG